jgi:SRSO17 transposase
MVAQWSAGFEAFVGRFAGRFPRVEPRRQRVAYLRGLLGEAERKNGWTLAEAVGETGPQGMQRLLNFYAWDADGVRDDVRAMVVAALGDAAQGVLIVDETGFVKKMTCSGTPSAQAHDGVRLGCRSVREVPDGHRRRAGRASAPDHLRLCE